MRVLRFVKPSLRRNVLSRLELRLDDETLIPIDCTAVENEVANSMYQRSELDWLIYNDPLAYAELILNGEPELYLKTVTKIVPLD